MYYKNGQRMFKTGSRLFEDRFALKDARGYVQLEDVETGVELFLPEFVIHDMSYVFSWNRYHQDMDKETVLQSLIEELNRLEKLPSSFNIEQGKKHMIKFISELRDAQEIQEVSC